MLILFLKNLDIFAKKICFSNTLKISLLKVEILCKALGCLFRCEAQILIHVLLPYMHYLIPSIFENMKYAFRNLRAKGGLKLRGMRTLMCWRGSLEHLQEVCLEEWAVFGCFPGVTYVKEDDPICNILLWTYFCSV